MQFEVYRSNTNTSNTQEQVVKKMSERETFGTNPILIYPTGFNLVTDLNLNPHTEIHTRL